MIKIKNYSSNYTLFYSTKDNEPADFVYNHSTDGCEEYTLDENINGDVEQITEKMFDCGIKLSETELEELKTELDHIYRGRSSDN